MNDRWTIYLDLDGVITDLVEPLMGWWGADMPEDKYPREFGWDIKGAIANTHARKGNIYQSAAILELSNAKFWQTPPRDFWRHLMPYEGAMNFIEWLEDGPCDVFIATAHASPDCAAAKVEWIEEHLPRYWDRVLVGHPKHLLANPHTILIDDRDKNCEDFIAADGHAALCPRPWNKGYDAPSALLDQFTGERRPPYNVIAQQLIEITNFVEGP